MPRTSSARCAGSQCFSTEPQYECEYGDGWCQTHVMGGGDAPPEGGGSRENSSLADFFPTYTVCAPNPLMSKAGIVVGDAISHINNYSPTDLADFARLVKELPAGTVLKVWRDGEMTDVVL